MRGRLADKGGPSPRVLFAHSSCWHGESGRRSVHYRLSGKRSHANRSVRRTTDNIRAEVNAPVPSPTKRLEQAAAYDFSAIERAVVAGGVTIQLSSAVFCQ